MKNTRRFAKLSANVPVDLVQLLDDLVSRHGPFATRHAVHLAALRIGLAELLAHPERVQEGLGRTRR